MKKVELEQGTQAWLDFRRNGVGASEIASIAGVPGAFQKRDQVMAEKLGQAKALTDFERRIFADGHEWEAVVRENLNAAGFNFKPAVVVARQHDRIFASLDGLDEERKIILEVKSVTTRAKFEQYSKEVPAHYMAQVQWQLFCSEYTTALIAFVHEGEVVTAEIKASPSMQVELYAAGVKFLHELDKVREGSMPSPIKALESQDMARLAYLKEQEREMKIQLEMVSEEVKQIAERILTEHGANKIESERVTIQYVERQGAIDYSKVAELRGVDLAPYRKRGSRFVQVNLKGGEA